MTRTVDAIPLWASGDHVPSSRCRCEPIEGSDLLEPSILVRIHKRIPIVPDVPPPDADRYLWRSRERSEAPPQGAASIHPRMPDRQTTRAPLRLHPVTMQEPDP